MRLDRAIDICICMGPKLLGLGPPRSLSPPLDPRPMANIGLEAPRKGGIAKHFIFQGENLPLAKNYHEFFFTGNSIEFQVSVRNYE